MDSTPGAEPDRHTLLPHGKYLLPPGRCLPARLATLLSLCCRDRSIAARARDAFPNPGKCSGKCPGERRNCLTKPKCCFLYIPCWQCPSGGNSVTWVESVWFYWDS